MLRIDNYWVAPAPDPHLFLSFCDDDKIDDTAIHLGLAPADTDHYARTLPNGHDYKAVKRVVVHCVKYDVFFWKRRVSAVVLSGGYCF